MTELIGELSESDILRRILARTPEATAAVVGPGDDAAVLALIAGLGLLQLGHETTPELAQLFAVSLLMWSMAAAPFRLWRARVGVVSALALIVIWSGTPGSYLWWSLYGLGAAVNVLAFTTLNEGFGRDLAGRTNTTLNLLMFGGSFITQWGIGVVVDATRAWFGLDQAGALRAAFAIVMVGNVITYAWFAYGWRRHAVVAPGPNPA